MNEQLNTIDSNELNNRPDLWSLIKKYCVIQYEELSNEMTIDDHVAELQYLIRNGLLGRLKESYEYEY